MKRFITLALGLLLLGAPGLAHAQQALTGTNVIEYDFASFTAAGFSPTPGAGMLDSDEWIGTRVNATDLAFGGTSADMDFANGTSMGGERAGGIWAFTPVSTMCASGPRTLLGVQPSNRTFTPGSFRVRVLNSTGAPLTEVFLDYTLAWLNNEERSMVHGVRALQVDGSGATTGEVMLPSLMFETPVASSPGASWESRCQSARIDLSSIPIADGSLLVIVFDFDDGSGGGSRDELGITDVRIGTMASSMDGGVPGLDAGVVTDAGVASDAGVAPDAGVATDAAMPDVDAGAVDVDGGTDPGLDSGVVTMMDAGGASPDAGATPMDSGSAAADAGPGPEAPDDGCGCSTVGRSTPPTGLLLLGLLLVSRWRRRRG